MTITLELTPEQEATLKAKARESGVEPAEVLLRLLDETRTAGLDAFSTEKGSQLRRETTGERLRRLGVLGGAAGKPRADGRPWSEVEGFE